MATLLETVKGFGGLIASVFKWDNDVASQAVTLVGADGTTYAGGNVPAGATSVVASSGNVAAATAAATLPAPGATKRNYLSGFAVTGGGATAASVINVTVTGLAGGTLTFSLAIPAGVTLGVVPLIVNFPVPLAASALNTAIVVSAPTFGAGNTNAATSAFGYTL